MNDELGELNEKRRKYINGDMELTDAIQMCHMISGPRLPLCAAMSSSAKGRK